MHRGGEPLGLSPGNDMRNGACEWKVAVLPKSERTVIIEGNRYLLPLGIKAWPVV